MRRGVFEWTAAGMLLLAPAAVIISAGEQMRSHFVLKAGHRSQPPFQSVRG